MDMWEPYVARATRAQVPAAEDKIVFDRFHCAKPSQRGRRFRVRRAEHRELKAAGDTRLTGTKYWPGSAVASPIVFKPAAWRAFAALRNSHAQGGPRLGAQGDPRRTCGSTSLRRGCPHLLPPLVLLGDALPAETDHRRGEDVEAPRGGPAVLLRAPHHQCRRRRPQLPPSRRSRSRPAATATANTSRPRSTSTSADYSSIRPRRRPTDFPEEPIVHATGSRKVLQGRSCAEPPLYTIFTCVAQHTSGRNPLIGLFRNSTAVKFVCLVTNGRSHPHENLPEL